MPGIAEKHVSVIHLELPEVSTAADLVDHMDQLHKGELLGMVIRGSEQTDIPVQTHKTVTDAVIDASAAAGHPMKKHRNSALSHGAGNGVGDFHTDCKTAEDMDRVRVHRTWHGAGRVSIAASGTSYARLHSPELLRLASTHELMTAAGAEVDKLALKELANPELINPNMYSADLEEGDTVIFPVSIRPSAFHQNAGPVWHRFSTSTHARHGSVYLLEPAK